MAGRAGKPVTRVPAFWDASALVSLCVRQGMTPRAIALYKNYDAVVWWATPVEIASALARLMRMKQLDSTDWAKASKLTKSLADSWSVIQPSDALRATSIQLVDRYDLRAADSLQLAAALEWCEYAPHGRVFLTADQKLRDAALLSGFDARQNVVASDRLKMLSRRKPNASKA
jgi:predicted nucleic acid-binding protein